MVDFTLVSSENWGLPQFSVKTLAKDWRGVWGVV